METNERNRVLTGIWGKVAGIREELAGYGAALESSTVEAEQTNSFKTAEIALNAFEAAVKALAFDE